jgi:hypothetical protein
MAVALKDIIRTTYKELFTVKFLHSGYGFSHNDPIANNIKLEPDEKTRNLFVNHNMGYRFLTDTLICYIRTVKTELLSPPLSPPETATHVPYIKFSGNVRIRFLINASNRFLNKTEVAATGAKQVYQFTNQVNTGTGGFISKHTDSTGVNNDDLANVAVVEPDRTCFGVIDIFNTGAVNSSYDLFNENVTQQLKSPAYTIPFKSKI